LLVERNKEETQKKHIENLPRAQTTSTAVWAHFVCDVARFRSQASFPGVVAGVAVDVDEEVLEGWCRMG
jgi:hypothetical protein